MAAGYHTAMPYTPADTPTTIHGYAWKGQRITAVQDYKLVNGKWLPYGAAYSLPDSVTIIHALPWKKNKMH
jgi:hypothetical protein